FEGNTEIYILSDKLPDTLGIGVGIINLTNNPAEDTNPDWPANCLRGIEVNPVAIEPTDLVPEPEPEAFVFGYASYDTNQFKRERNFQTACDELGIECIYGDLPDLINQGVDAIIQNSDNMTVQGLHNDILSARDAGIPVFLLDAESITHGAYSITIDHSKWAKTSLGWLLEKIGGSGEIAYFDLDPFNRYTDTIKDLLSRYPDITVADFRDGKYDPSKIKPETSDFVKAYPNLKAIWNTHDSNQAMWGLEGNGIPYNQWPSMVCEANLDGLLLWEKAQQAYPEFDCFAVANPPGIAYDAVYAAYFLVSGYEIDTSALSGPYGQSLYVDFPEVTKD
ncbi:MAG: simple sugar transport system substrate-binding protein, partial [Bacteroidetes bacterium]